MPILSDLDAAMMQPGFSVPALRRLGGGSIRLNDAGRPLHATGRDAVVYELRAPDGRILALRCFLRPVSSRDTALAERYAALGGDPRLDPLRGPEGPLPREIRWIDDGITLPGPDLRRITAPVIAMERVPGRTLLRAVDRLCLEGRPEPLKLLADAWLATALTLEESGFCHGDLAADNLIVRPDGTIALVDLDSASWPSAAAPAAPTAGTPGYAHPRGTPLEPERRDRFPALILWASLRILIRHPTLRERWGDRPDGEGAALLWSADDLRRPTRAPLMLALDALDDETLLPLLEVVRRAIRFPPDETPPLLEIVERLEELGFPASASAHVQRHHGPSRDVPERAPASIPEGEPLGDARAGEWDDAGMLPGSWSDDRLGRSPDAGRTTTLVERDRRLAAAERLRAAVASRDTAAAARVWAETRAAPEAATYAAAVHLLVAHDATSAIERAIRRRDDEGLLEAIAGAERDGVAPSAAARTAARLARHRITARGALREALARDDPRALATLARSGTLECLGRLEAPQAKAVSRALAWPALERALAADDDATIVAAADPALWREEGALPGRARQRLELAWSRLRWTGDVRAALKRRDGAALRALLATGPPRAEDRRTQVESPRIQRKSNREAALSRLEKALREGPDREVVAALAEFESAGAPFPAVLDWAAVRGVVDRISLAEAIRAAATATPPDTAKLARLLPAARAALGDAAVGGGPDWAALELSVLQAAHLARLREALFADDDARIASAAEPDPYGARALLTSAERSRVERALTHVPRRRA
jgi:hypothetical protein